MTATLGNRPLARGGWGCAALLMSIVAALAGLAAVLPSATAVAAVPSALPMVSTGQSHSCGVRTDGRVVCWGLNGDNESVPPPEKFKVVSAGGFHTCGVRLDDTLACWGRNLTGQSSPPSGAFAMVSAGTAQSCAVAVGGSVACWGFNGNGEGSPPTGAFKMVSVARNHTCGVRADGTLACWGVWYYGPPPAGTFSTVSATSSHACAIRTNGSLACWGDNFSGESSPPAGSFTSVTAGQYHSCGIRSDAVAMCWGLNAAGESSPPSGAFSTVTAGYGEAEGTSNTCGVLLDGTVECWGSDNWGKSSPPSSKYTMVSPGGALCGVRADGSLKCRGVNPSSVAAPPGPFLMIAVGSHSCAIRADRTITCWGDNSYGQLAAPAGTFSTVAVGPLHSCGVRTDETLACWNYNANGQSSPPSGRFKSVVVGEYHSCGVRIDGTVTCWGWQGYRSAGPRPGVFSQLAAGGQTTCGIHPDQTATCWESGFELFSPDGPFTAVATSGRSSCGLRPGGRLVCWGEGTYDSTSPPLRDAPSAGDFTSLTVSRNRDGAAPGATGCATRVDNVFQCWGDTVALGEPFGSVSMNNRPSLVPLASPARLLDTRSPAGRTVDGRFQAVGRIVAGGTFELAVAGRGGVPATAASVSMNVTAALTGGAGYLTVFPCGVAVPDASNVNFAAGETVPNAAFVRIGAAGKVCLFSSATTDVIVDVSGYAPDATGFVPLASPARVLDTRTPGGRTVDGRFQARGHVGRESVTEFVVAERGGVAIGAAAIAMNVTVVNPLRGGYLTFYSCGDFLPNSSNLNFETGQTVANAVITRLAVTTTVCLFSSAETDVIVDVAGFFPTTSNLTTLALPIRLLDTRAERSRLRAGETYELLVRGVGGRDFSFGFPGKWPGVAHDAESVALNVTVADAGGDGFLTVYPCGTTRPDASNLNFVQGQTVPNAVLAKVGLAGKVCLYTSTATDVIVDVSGYLSPP
jgi:alpha-tubulin suppressor-like RCC1 family protein